ncbi:ABC-type Co2+ transport system, permease component, partial [Acididesulfobacillus acetoxydans]
MHIPDGYLSPQTDALMGIVSASVLGIAAKKTSKTLSVKNIPLLSVGAAFCFTLMMFNVPIPDGTTAHAVGGSLLAILFGPWTAAIGVSIALVIQAIFFGDGGILALGANIF